MPVFETSLGDETRGESMSRARVIQADASNGLLEFLGVQGDVLNTVFLPQMDQLICFTPDTSIMTIQGAKPAGSLKAGDVVMTRDNGTQELLWVGRKTLGLGALIAYPHLAPVTIAAGALGQGLPERDLTVSPNHRIMIRSNVDRLLFDATETLTEAKDLLDRPSVTQFVPNSVTYIHLMFETQELVMSEGSWTESYLPRKHSSDLSEAACESALKHRIPECSLHHQAKKGSAKGSDLSRVCANLECVELQ